MTPPLSAQSRQTRSLSADSLPPNATTENWVIQAPSRLHFGLLSWGGAGRQFGGVGAMIAQPELVLRCERAASFCAEGANAARLAEYAQRWSAFHRVTLPAVRLSVAAMGRPHTGLGTGTQMGLAVAAALAQSADIPLQSAVTLAQSVGRGLRSAVGTYGFWYGGLIAEHGKLAEETISPLDTHLSMPADWRFVLVTDHALVGLHGTAESSAFATLPDVPAVVAESLRSRLDHELIPALRAADFAAFSEALYAYGFEAGNCFASQQGGAYNGPRLTDLVQRLRGFGITGVGQSSWGPTLFALVPNDEMAHGVVNWLKASADATTLDLQIAAPDNDGARCNGVALRQLADRHS